MDELLGEIHTPDGHCSSCCGPCCFNEDHIDMSDMMEPEPEPEPGCKNVILRCGESEGSVSPPPLKPVAIDMRFTFSGQDKDLNCLLDKQFIGRCKSIHKSLLNHMIKNEYFYKSKFTSGFETQSTSGENCKAHLHLRFYTIGIVASVRRAVKDFLLKKFEEDTHGNASFMFKPAIPRDDDDFFGYCLKWSRGFVGGICSLDHDRLCAVGKSILERQIQKHQNKMDKMDKTDTLNERIKAHLKKQNIKTKNEICLAILQFNKDEDRSFTYDNLIGKANLLMCQLNLITNQEFLDKKGNL